MWERLDLKKQRLAKISIIVLAVLLVLSMLPFKYGRTGSRIGSTGVAHAAVPYVAKDIALNPGANETKLNFTWYSPEQPTASIVQMAKKSAMTDAAFPVAAATVFTGTASQAATVSSVIYYSNKVTATGLEPSTQYVYRVGDGNDSNWSPVYNFSTQDSSNYQLMFVGDPQIGASGSVANDTAGFTNTLNKAVAAFPNISYIMSAGDQVEHSTTEAEYDAFESPDVMRNLPMASVVGNHDTNVNYKYHFNVPNESTLGATNASGDYYYTYGDSLFMVLNTNNTNSAEHVTFMNDTVAAVPNTKWRFVTFHHDLYGAGPHSTESVITGMRAALFPAFDALDIDMIFMGHDHSFVRTYVMNGDNVQGRQLVDSQGRDVNPTGSTYVTANSSSGSKYYELMTTPEVYSEVRMQVHTPTFSMISVTPNSATVDTYRSDTMEKLDTYGLVKEGENAKIYAKSNEQADTTANIEFYYAISHANAVKQLDTKFSYDAAKLKFKSAALVTPDAGTFSATDDAAGNVAVQANLATPIQSAAYDEYTDVVKLTFELVDKQSPALASVQLKDSALTTLNKHKGLTSNIVASTAEVSVGGTVTQPDIPNLQLAQYYASHSNAYNAVYYYGLAVGNGDTGLEAEASAAAGQLKQLAINEMAAGHFSQAYSDYQLLATAAGVPAEVAADAASSTSADQNMGLAWYYSEQNNLYNTVYYLSQEAASGNQGSGITALIGYFADKLQTQAQSETEQGQFGKAYTDYQLLTNSQGVPASIAQDATDSLGTSANMGQAWFYLASSQWYNTVYYLGSELQSNTSTGAAALMKYAAQQLQSQAQTNTSSQGSFAQSYDAYVLLSTATGVPAAIAQDAGKSIDVSDHDYGDALWYLSQLNYDNAKYYLQQVVSKGNTSTGVNALLTYVNGHLG